MGTKGIVARKRVLKPLLMLSLVCTVTIGVFLAGVPAGFIPVAAADATPSTESELRDAVAAAPDTSPGNQTPYSIELQSNIQLTTLLSNGPLEIPHGTNIELTSASGNSYQIIGVDTEATIEVQGNLIIDGIIITHLTGQTGCGVFVNGGSLTMLSGQISGNSADYGGGLHIVSTTATVDLNGGEIYDNTAKHGGGIYADYSTTSSISIDGTSIHSNEATDGHGGGIFSGALILTISKGAIYANQATDGAGIYLTNEDSAFSMSGGTVYQNIADTNGGGIYNKAELSITGGSIYGNQATRGGGIYNEDSVIDATLDGCSVYNNTAGYGGGVYNVGMLTLSSGAIYANVARTNGGGVCNYGSSTDPAFFTMSGGTIGSSVVINANTAPLGGGVFNTYGTFNMTAGIIIGNRADTNGGGVYNSSVFTMSDGEITGNRANGASILENGGGGVYNNNASMTMLGGSISANTTTSRGGGVYSLNGGSFTMSGGVVGGVIEGYGNNAHYGGGIAINVGAIFAMTDTARVSYNNASSNGGGVYQYGGNIEMNNGEIAYNKATENGGGVWRNAGGFDASIDCKIHNNTANRYGGGIYATAFGAVSFNATIYSNEALDGGGIYIQARGVIYKIDGSISITENIATRNGGGIFINAGILEILNNAVISGNIAGSDGGGIYSNTSGSLSLTGGRILSNTAGNDGGGIYIAVGTSNLIAGTEISSNTASGGGGGVYCNSTCTMNAGSILSNTAENGGGIYNAGTFSLSTSGSAVIASNIAHENGGGVYNAGILNMFGSVVGGLSATEANTAKNGAGIYNTATFTMSAGAVIGNNATDYGGGVFIAGTSATLNMTGGIISENIAASGGGLYNMDGTLSISKTGTVSPQITYNIAYNQGGGVYSYGDDSVIDMSDGSISYNQAKLGGGVLFMRGQFLMTGGQISTNEAQFGAGVFCDGSFTLKDGIIELNTVTDDGGGVYVYIGGVLSMEDGQIVNNQATGVGGGVCIARIDYSGGTFEMLGGQIGANSANLGGGVFNDGSFIMSGGIISANTALSDGGGVFLTGSGSFEISGTSKISNNIAIRNGGGIFIPYEFLNSLTVGAGVTFFNNTAVASYERSPLDDAMYFANILCPDWSDSLTQGYNNFDISYISCTITFNGNGGVVSPSDTTRLVPQVSKLTSYMPANPIRIGYVFYSWNTLSNGTGTIFTGDTIVDTDITVYAQWTAIPYTVTYNGNGNTSGSVPASPATYSYNDTVIVLGNTGNFAKTGYTFIGWSTNPTAVASTYSPGYAFPIQSNITLYAVWQESGKYTVTVNGSYAATTGTGSYGQGANVTINAGTRDGYTFSGWTVTVGGVTLASASSATTTFTMPANDVTVTANWTQVLYTVTVNGSYAATTGAGSYGQGTNVTINAGTRDGYTFSGWTVTTGGVTLASAGIATTTFTMPANNVTVTANWTQNPAPTTYTVTYNGNGNSGGSVPVDSASPYNAGSTVTVIGNTGNLVKTGYTFLGWSTNQSATTAQYTAGSTFIINSNTTLYAVWQAETEATYRVTYVGGGDTRGVAPIDPNSYHAGDKATVLGAGNLVRSNYAFLGWSTSASATTVEYKADDSITVNGNITLYAVWESESASPPWALLNLILAITGALVAIGTLVYAFARKNKNTKMLWLIVSIVLGIAGLIVFFLTEKTGNPMVFMDWWTIVNAVILVLGVIGVKFAFKRKEETSRRNAR